MRRRRRRWPPQYQPVKKSDLEGFAIGDRVEVDWHEDKPPHYPPKVCYGVVVELGETKRPVKRFGRRMPTLTIIFDLEPGQTYQVRGCLYEQVRKLSLLELLAEAAR